MITHTGGWHCGRVRFEVDAPKNLDIDECNCSICSKSGYLHLIVPAPRAPWRSVDARILWLHDLAARRRAA